MLLKTREFFENEVLNKTEAENSLGSIHWPVFTALCISWVAVYICLCKGINLTGKIAKYTVIVPYIILAIFFVRVLFLDGYLNGILFLIKPTFSKLFSFNTWIKAAT